MKALRLVGLVIGLPVAVVISFFANAVLGAIDTAKAVCESIRYEWRR